MSGIELAQWPWTLGLNLTALEIFQNIFSSVPPTQTFSVNFLQGFLHCPTHIYIYISIYNVYNIYKKAPRFWKKAPLWTWWLTDNPIERDTTHHGRRFFIREYASTRKQSGYSFQFYLILNIILHDATSLVQYSAEILLNFLWCFLFFLRVPLLETKLENPNDNWAIPNSKRTPKSH